MKLWAAIVVAALVSCAAFAGVLRLNDSRQNALRRADLLSQRVFTPASKATSVEEAFRDSEAGVSQNSTIVWCSKRDMTACMAEEEFLLYVRTENDLVSLHAELAKVARRMSMECYRATARDGSWSAGYCTFKPAPLPKGPKA